MIHASGKVLKMLLSAHGFRLGILFPLTFILLVSCKETLYSNLQEVDANEMVSVLEASGIPASRSRDKKGIYEVLVDADMVAVAVSILRKEGLPRENFKNIGDIFSTDGVVTTPFAEKARFIYALNEELSATISAIKGVKRARVLITMTSPESRFSREIIPSRASVTIQYEKGFDRNRFVPSIKTLVSHSVPNLEYEGVVVVLFPAGGSVATQVIQPQLPNAANAAGLPPENALNFLPVRESGARLGALIIALMGALFLLALVRYLRRSQGRG